MEYFTSVKIYEPLLNPKPCVVSLKVQNPSRPKYLSFQNRDVPEETVYRYHPLFGNLCYVTWLLRQTYFNTVTGFANPQKSKEDFPFYENIGQVEMHLASVWQWAFIEAATPPGPAQQRMWRLPALSPGTTLSNSDSAAANLEALNLSVSIRSVSRFSSCIHQQDVAKGIRKAYERLFRGSRTLRNFSI